ncbi:MAG: hypothetical protein U0807_18920 [Candidatus Binatia bacterium]
MLCTSRARERSFPGLRQGGCLNPPGPLFVGPAASHGLPWLAILSLVVAAPAAVILVWGLARGRVPQPLALAGVLLPIGAYGLGSFLLLETSKEVAFCGSCHVMTPILESLGKDDGSLASLHYVSGRVPHDEACYTCHSGYGIWGGANAKMAGIRHMLHTITGRYDLPLELNGSFNIDSCLTCHARAERFRAVEAHQPLDVQQALLSHEMSCTGLCHPAAHPDSALKGGTPAS